MRILLTGSSGLIGRNLEPVLRDGGHEVIRLVRKQPEDAASVFFDPHAPDASRLEEFDAVIHLAGQNVAQRWTKRRKASILASRADFTRALCGALAKTNRPPAHFLSASGINYYGYQRSDPLTEEAATGEGFLAEVCRQWEAANAPLEAHSRVVRMRAVVVLSPQGGALAKLLTPFRLGMGGVMGSGRQIMSWISLPDMLAAIAHILNTPTLAGPVNMTSPNPVTNREFTRTLAKALHRPALVRMPASLVKLAFGRMAVETILANHNAVPAKLLVSGFVFKHPTLAKALAELLNR